MRSIKEEEKKKRLNSLVYVEVKELRCLIFTNARWKITRCEKSLRLVVGCVLGQVAVVAAAGGNGGGRGRMLRWNVDRSETARRFRDE